MYTYTKNCAQRGEWMRNSIAGLVSITHLINGMNDTARENGDGESVTYADFPSPRIVPADEDILGRGENCGDGTGAIKRVVYVEIECGQADAKCH
jgi:hypothetical protein